MPTHHTFPYLLNTSIVITSIVALGSSCTQPLPHCTAAHKPYAAEYTLTDGDPDSVCGQLRGDRLGMQTYYQEGGKNGTPDYGTAKVAIRAGKLGELIEYALAQEAVKEDVFYRGSAIGNFTAGFPNDDGFCMADEFDEARVILPDIAAVPDDPMTMDMDETQPARPTTTISYRWSNARFLVSADAQGTQFEADLEYTQDDCTAKYHVVAVNPAVTCKSNEDCNNEKNGINPDFALRCNTELELCVLSEDLPAYE